MCLFVQSQIDQHQRQPEHHPEDVKAATANVEPKVDLSSWVSRLKAKETLLKGSRDRDLRREVLVSKAVQKAQQQLETAQRQRRLRWEQLKRTPRCLKCFCLPSLCCCETNTSNSVINNLNLKEDEASQKIDEFLASLNSMSLKRKQSDDSVDSISDQGQKRVKLAKFAC